MTDRKALAAALKEYRRLGGYKLGTTDVDRLAVAARERLAQLPEKCGTCEGGDIDTGCSVCHGSGKVYPAELVERIIRAIADRAPFDNRYIIAVAVLDALNGVTDAT